MPTTSRPKTEDKFSRARAAKNSPKRVKGKKQSDRPENLSEKKRPTPRGPSSAKPRQLPPGYGFKSKATGERAPDPSRKEFAAKNKVRDEERVFNLVHAILSAWKADVGNAEHTAASAGIIKVSRRKIEGALRDLKNTRFTKIPTLINDVLVYNEVCNEFGQWVYVEHDSPDWIFVRLPENSTQVIRADISSDRSGETSAAVTTSVEVLLDNTYLEDDEEEIPENVEYDDEDESDANEEEDEEE
ncbi:hypothetical protein HOU09_gp309 [Dickeya phage vB_DsoM_AD1]|uniref:Uncharacterized protein n=1 Tax=Dickeya phage vB_DsoM_AD1 TaxID=2283029 RepID=A0A384ZYK9_9CAUD|nr:hypothetical protein HOU09_gp309 [Dickeya phage vB_DsoM_AD1]AXG67353.1 hypothetical protein AD1_309 [Dickeya phage vB_DsoM_AD1]